MKSSRTSVYLALSALCTIALAGCCGGKRCCESTHCSKSATLSSQDELTTTRESGPLGGDTANVSWETEEAASEDK